MDTEFLTEFAKYEEAKTKAIIKLVLLPKWFSKGSAERLDDQREANQHSFLPMTLSTAAALDVTACG